MKDRGQSIPIVNGEGEREGIPGLFKTFFGVKEVNMIYTKQSRYRKKRNKYISTGCKKERFQHATDQSVLVI